MVAKNQHTVTRAYLKRWADHDQRVHIFDVDKREARRQNISTVTAQRYFYSPADGEQSFERNLAQLEAFWVKAQEKLIAAAAGTRRGGRYGPKIIYKQDKVQLADGLVQQLVRTERVRNGFQDSGENDAREAHLQFMVRPEVVGLGQVIERGIWLICTGTQESGPLYTSDHPVVIIPREPKSAPSNNRIKGFMFPLSPAHLLVIYAPGTSDFRKEQDGRLVPLTESLVMEANGLQANSAERVVISTMPDFDVARRWSSRRRQAT